MNVRLIGYTHALIPPGIYVPQTHYYSQQIVEFSGRLCYRSFHNPSGRTNEEYIANLIKQGHYSVLEHSVASLLIEGISRACSHELVRHRHFSYSQESLRYIEPYGYVVPDVLTQDMELLREYHDTAKHCFDCYEKLTSKLQQRMDRKHARQAARYILPLATQTSLVVTGNLRAWRHFLRVRAVPAADVEIRQLALLCFSELKRVAPAMLCDVEEQNGYLVFHSQGED